MPEAETATPKPAQPPLQKLALEMGPLVLFFLSNYRFGLYAATAVLMVSVVTAVLASYYLTRKWPLMPVVTAVAVVLFGGLTLYFHNPTFIKMKPTIINIIFGCALLGSLAMNKLILPTILDQAFHIDEAGWRKLTLRWGLFFFFLAALNELVWRTQSEQFWVAFKVWGTMPITIAFMATQIPLLTRHEIKSVNGDQG
ncbi:MAG: septation protein A [Hyphomicrobiales bacterium]|nr:septation protein A [Hyphomicrobiales bacterium]